MLSRNTPYEHLANPLAPSPNTAHFLLSATVALFLITAVSALFTAPMKASGYNASPATTEYTIEGSASHDEAPVYEPPSVPANAAVLLADNVAPAEESDVLRSYDVPDMDTSAKRYMDFRTITSRSSKQWQLQQSAVTDENGFRRYGDDYMIALGTYYTGYECGKRFRITLDTGVSFEAITGDIKSDAHTDALHQHRDGNVVEFIVDTDVIPHMCQLMGDMSYAEAVDFSGCIAKIEELK